MSIVSITEATRLLAEAKTLEDTLEITSRASALEAYARSKHAKEAEYLAVELKLRAARKAGFFLKDNVQHQGASVATPSNKLIPDGITKIESSRYQALASIPEVRFEKVLASAQRKSQNALLILANELKNEERKKNLVPIASQRRDLSLFEGSFMEMPLLEQSVDLIATDPPYGAEYKSTWEDFARWAFNKLKEGGYVFVMCGQAYLVQFGQFFLEAGFTGPWVVAVLQSGNRPFISNFMVCWKPILVFRRGAGQERFTMPDVINSPISDRRKDLHPWQQPVEIFRKIVHNFSKAGALVAEPFAGAGTTLEACVMEGRRCAAAEVDPDTVELLRKRFPCAL